MSDALIALTAITVKCAERGEKEDASTQNCYALYKLLEEIVVLAGDSIEDHVEARVGVKQRVRKNRVFRACVDEIAAVVRGCSQDTPKGPPYALELIEEILDAYKVII